MLNVVVTGGAGYVGSHVMWALHEAGFYCHAVDRLTGGGHCVNLMGLPFTPLSYEERLTRPLLERADAIVHCAALTSAPESVDHPGRYYRENVNDMTFLLDIAASRDIPVVFSSSAAVYGEAGPDEVVSERHQIDPPNPYGMTKAIGERMLLDWGVPHLSLRYFNVAGADSFLRCGPIGYRGSLFSNILTHAIKGTLFTLNRASGETPDMFPVRDFIHPTDLARAHVKALDALVSGVTKNQPLNVGSGQGHSIKEILDEFMLYAPDLRVRVGDARKGDPSSVVADVSLIKRVLGWEATPLSGVREMVRTAWEWEQKISEKI